MNPRLARLVAGAALVAIGGAGTAASADPTLPDLHFAPGSDAGAAMRLIWQIDETARNSWNAEMYYLEEWENEERQSRQAWAQAACGCEAPVPIPAVTWPYL